MVSVGRVWQGQGSALPLPYPAHAHPASPTRLTLRSVHVIMPDTKSIGFFGFVFSTDRIGVFRVVC